MALLSATAARLAEQCIVRLRVRSNCVSKLCLRRAHKYTQVSTKPNRYKAVYRDLHGAIEDPTTARAFVYALDSQERHLLQVELHTFHDDNSQTEPVIPPTAAQLKRVVLHNCLPFIGFGFLDNFLMIVAGEYIEFKFGVLLGISTMAAAAFGNLISDVAGVQSAHYVEILASKLGVKAPALLPRQVDMPRTRWASSIGKVIGVVIGCILGMCPLFFYEPKKKKSENSGSEKGTDKEKAVTPT